MKIPLIVLIAIMYMAIVLAGDEWKRPRNNLSPWRCQNRRAPTSVFKRMRRDRNAYSGKGGTKVSICDTDCLRIGFDRGYELPDELFEERYCLCTCKRPVLPEVQLHYL
uniref:Phosphoribosylaminoimidazole-succinocarboxamide synthase n=1 Tax=Lygus hesperus TaxID=30085 RepID=A0A0A9Z0L1_LYGHE